MEIRLLKRGHRKATKYYRNLLSFLISETFKDSIIMVIIKGEVFILLLFYSYRNSINDFSAVLADL